ncbi:nucleotidyltransferase family protein [Maribacter sp.]|uniref:nucleotidyltransferase family protein n=1 Tax=Maribacter sp. TaxID=1897614 RepID=UPI0025C259E6|nr:nucleotidyltransferase family protein [Maribacter sp.]
MSNNNAIAIVILAAGSSSRMKTIKQLLPWKGSTFLGHTIQVAKASLAQDVYVVLGANADQIILECNKHSVNYLVNKVWQEGMGTSIACGVKHLLQTKKPYTGVLILLCDQPFINTDYINKLIIAYKKSPKNSIATKYKHGVGVPALFSQASFKELSLLSQDFGAKDILRKEENQRIDILPNFDTTDIDTEKSYNLLNF